MNQYSIPSQRIAYIDIAKGLGILLVILGHNYVKASVPGMEQFIFSFHMPFFFMLSGILFKPDYSLLILFKRRFATLMLPYFTSIILLYSVYFFYTDIKIMTLLRRVGRSFYASGSYIEWAQLWFLPHLFILNVFVGILFLLLYRHIKWSWLRLSFLAGMLWVGVTLLPMYYMQELVIAGQTILLDGFPASMDLILITATYFLIGFEIRKLVPESFFTSLWTLVSSGLLLIVLNVIFPYRLDLFFRTYDSFIWNTLEVLSGSVFILSISSWIAMKQNQMFALLKYLGQITIILLIFHQPVQRLTFGHVMQVIENPYLAGVVSFLAAVGVPVFIHQVILKANPKLASWFGLRNLHPSQTENRA